MIILVKNRKQQKKGVYLEWVRWLYNGRLKTIKFMPKKSKKKTSKLMHIDKDIM